MSRIIVKNLPKAITEEKIRSIFGEKGLVTDVQLKYTAEGKFRRFGFVGYKSTEEADEAIKFFNNTRINTSKISVESCALLGDTNKPRAWSKYATDSTAYKKNHPEIEAEKKDEPEEEKVDATANLLEKYKEDPLFEEFIQIHAPKEAEKILGKKQVEDDKTEVESELDSGQESDSSLENEEDVDKPANQKISDVEYMQLMMKKSESKPRQKQEKKPKEKVELFTLKLHGLPYGCKKKEIKQFFKPLAPYSIRVPQQIKGIAYVGFKQEKQFNKALLKDRSFISGKRISVFKYERKEEEKVEQADPKRCKWKSQEESLKNEEDIGESGRIFLRNLAYTTTENDVQELFSKYGPLTEVNLPIDSTTRIPKGFGVLTFLMPEHAVKAYTELDGSILHGRMLHLLPGKAKDNEEQDTEESSNYKKKKELKQKSQAGSSHNWNALFLGHDAVAEVVANTYGTTKEHVLDPHGDGSAAVRLALGETQIVATTRKYLEQEGVLLDTFGGSTAKRSKTIILVKNLPANTQSKELYSLFEKHGVVGRVILPPSGITAIVEFIEPTEARKAFTRLAYSKFKNLPLYLEWAPENSLTAKKEGAAAFKRDAQEEREEIDDAQEPEEADESEDEEPEADTTLFVKNLNFQSMDDDLYKHFEACGKIKYATVALKKDRSDPDKKLSMGYGFVRFIHKASADKALKTLQQSQLDGKSLEIKRSERTLQNEVQSTRRAQTKTKQTGTKLLVRNIPFQAKKSEIMELFKTFGEIKALRLPKKMTVGSDQHRGFAFVDYFTKGEAKKAFEALSQSTHLYGRRLVLEWASAEEGVDEIRKRTAEHFHPTVERVSKKSVLSTE